MWVPSKGKQQPLWQDYLCDKLLSTFPSGGKGKIQEKKKQSNAKTLSIVLLPGHPWVLHAFVCWDGPRQYLPPLEGAGLSQVLVLYCEPPPQLLVHRLYCPHGDQWPSTVNTGGLISIAKISFFNRSRIKIAKKHRNAFCIVFSTFPTCKKTSKQ